MELEYTPNPDSILRSIQQDEKKKHRGKLKIYLGMAPGVGKTYSMLSHAQDLYAKGVNIVIGYVEPHKRKETEKLIENLPSIPTKKIEYGSIILEELNVDEILNVRPHIVLVDELAHTNAPNLRHKKRYEDVIELLEAGISVHSTLNVQHIESRRDIVAKITGVFVQETIPDSILDYVTEFELVDLSPNELLQRLNDGKIYSKEVIQEAQKNFFTFANLSALREIALRLTSERVEHQLDEYTKKEHIIGPWKSGEKFLTAIGPSPYSANLLRWTKRLSSNFNARWYAVYVDTLSPLSPEQELQLNQNIELARDLGAIVIKTINTDIVAAIIATANDNNITQLVIGKSKDSFLSKFFNKGSLLEKLLQNETNFDIHIVPPSSNVTLTKKSNVKTISQNKKLEYIYSLLGLGILSSILFPFTSFIGYHAIGLVILLYISLLSLYASRGPVVFTAIVSSLIWNFFFIPPIFTFIINSFTDVLMLVMFSAIAVISGYFTSTIAQQTTSVKLRERHAAFNTKLSNMLAEVYSLEDQISIISKELSDYFHAMISIFLVNDEGKIELKSNSEGFESLGEKEMSVIEWAFSNNKISGKYTKNIPSANGLYIPIVSQSGVLGILGVQFTSNYTLTHYKEDELYGIIPLISTAFEREIVRNKLQQKNVEEVSENLYKTIINTLSHEFKTPISIVAENASQIIQQLQNTTPNMLIEVEFLANEVITSSDRLTRLVNNLLDVSRIENGMLTLKQDWCDINDVISTSVQSLKDMIQSHKIETIIQNNFPFFKADIVLLSQAISNIIHNSCKYTPTNSTITISANFDNKNVYIAVEDNGPGIKPEFISQIFEKFYRVPGVIPGGTGLGLAITKSIIESHSGKISVKNMQKNGVRFSITIPTTFQEVAIIE